MNLPLNVDLKGKIAVVTGGGGVLGSYFCEALALSGAKVAVVNRTKEKAQTVVDRIVEAGAKLPQFLVMYWILLAWKMSEMNFTKYSGPAIY